MLAQGHQSTVKFIKLIKQGRPPERADRAAGGTVPTRAFRYCEALTTATALGWYAFPPITFSLFWTGSETFWTYHGASDFYPLRSAQFPGFVEYFDQRARPDAVGYAPPFLAALPEPGLIQIWPGLLARTKPDWSLLVRGPANLPRPGGYDLFEGMIEADRWLGPLFINVRLTRTGSPITFEQDHPLLQIQPFDRRAYNETVMRDFSVCSIDEVESDEWDAYIRAVVRPTGIQCPHGQYAAAVRIRRHQDNGEAVSVDVPLVLTKDGS